MPAITDVEYTVGVHQRGVNGQHTRHLATPRDPGGEEREIEELTVLVNDVGANLVEQSLQSSDRSRTDHERQRVVERQVAGRIGPRPKSHDVDTVDILGRSGAPGTEVVTAHTSWP